MYSQRTKRDHETYESTANSRSENKEFMSEVPQAMSKLDAYKKLLQYEFTERSSRNGYQCVPYI